MSFLFLFGLSFALSVIFTPIAILISKKFKIMDDPRSHKHPALLHRKAIARGGGISIFAAIILISLFFLPKTKEILGIFLGGSLLVAVGIIDDRLDLNKWVKLLVQFLAALVVVGAGVGIAFITNPVSFLGGTDSLSVLKLDSVRLVFNFLGEHSVLIVADLFAVLWIVWVINMVNFSSGVDGQMPGIVFVSLMVLFVVSLKFGGDPEQFNVSKLAIISAGSTLGFLIFNFAPAKIFPGDSGSYLLGFMVAVLSILSGAKVGTAVLVMAVPLTDGVFTIIRRITSRKSPFVGDRGHLHHKLLQLGFSQRQVALFYWVLCAILGASALMLDSAGKLFAGIVIAIVIFGGLTWLNIALPIKVRK